MRRSLYALIAVPLSLILTTCSVLSARPSKQELLEQLVSYRTAAAEMSRATPQISRECKDDWYNAECIRRMSSIALSRGSLVQQGAIIVRQIGEDAAVESLTTGYNPTDDRYDEIALMSMILKAKRRLPKGNWWNY